MTRPCTLLALLLGACASTSPLDQSRHLTATGEPFRAFEVLDAERDRLLAAGEPLAGDFERAWQDARIAFLIARARRSIFLEREPDALVDLARVLALSPHDQEAPVLRERAAHKLAVRATELGDELLVQNDLQGALLAYLEAERHEPGFEGAAKGAEKVRLAVAKLEARAQQQFLEAVRKLPEFRYVEVRWHSANALTNDPQRADAEVLRARAQRELAQLAVERARECQTKDQFGAALVEYRAAKKFVADLPGVDDAIAAMEREVEAQKLAERAQIDMRLQRFEAAHVGLQKAFGLSTLARGGISELMIQARRLEGERDYGVGRDFEIQGKKREALAAFEALAKNWPEGLLDEQARVEGLRSDIEAAAKEWQAGEAAEAAGELQKALEHFLASERFYGAYRDAKARIQALRGKLQPSG